MQGGSGQSGVGSGKSEIGNRKNKLMSKSVKRQPQKFSADEFLRGDLGLPERTELVKGMIGPFSDEGMRTLLANWGVDKIIEVTGPGIWREALAAQERSVQ